MALLPFGVAPTPNATSSKLGKIQLAGDIAGSATAPTIKSSVSLSGSPTTTTQASTDNSTKIATTAYVTTGISNAISGVNPAIAVQAATTLASNTSGFTYNNGVSGVGATLTQNSAAVYTVDGFTFTSTTQRLLVKNDTQTTGGASAGAFNGIYLCTTVGTSLIPAVFTRALDYDTPSDINNTGAIPVVNGTVNALTSWLLTSQVSAVGTDALTYTQFSYSPTSVIPPNLGGTGIANNSSMTVTGSGNFGYTRTLTGTTNVTFPTSGTITAQGNSVTGSGNIVLATSPTLATPVLGVATMTSINKMAVTAPTTAATLAFNTDNTTQTFQGSDTIVGRATTDTLTNKTLTSPVVNQFGSASGLGAAYTNYTPTWAATGTGPAIGNGTLSGWYKQIGKVTEGYITFTTGSTSTFGTGTYTFSLPQTASSNYTSKFPLGDCYLEKNGVTGYVGISRMVSTTTVEFIVTVGNAAYAQWGATSPFTLTTGGDFIRISFSYEAA